MGDMYLVFRELQLCPSAASNLHSAPLQVDELFRFLILTIQEIHIRSSESSHKKAHLSKLELKGKHF